MNQHSQQLCALTRLLGIGALILMMPLLAIAAPAPSGWIDQRASPISTEAAAAMIRQRAIDLAQQRAQQSKLQKSAVSSSALAVSSAAATLIPSAASEYSQVASALENNPRRIYQFVRNNFTYVPYYGALKGAYLTLKERSGNDFDQAAVLVELLRAAGFTANFQYGTMTIPITASNGLDMAHWLGTEANATVIGNIVASGGIPVSGNTANLTMDRLWVVATINGSTVALDPAFKPGNRQSAINLATAIGYKQADVLNAAGGVLGTNSIQSLNAPGLNAELNALTTQLLSYINQNSPNATVNDIVGGLSIIPDESNSLPTGLPFAGTPSQSAWTSIPSGYIHTARLQLGSIDTTLNTPQLAGKKLSIHYVGDSVTIAPAPAGAVDFGSVSPGQDGSSITWKPKYGRYTSHQHSVRC